MYEQYRAFIFLNPDLPVLQSTQPLHRPARLSLSHIDPTHALPSVTFNPNAVKSALRTDHAAFTIPHPAPERKDLVEDTLYSSRE